MANSIEDSLGKALAPKDDVFDIVEEEGVVDPLAEGNELTVEEDPLSFSIDGQIPDNDLSSLPDTAIQMSNAMTGEEGDEVEIVDSTIEDEDLVEMPEEDEIEVQADEDLVDYLEPGELITAVLQKARKFAAYANDSQNSIRRAEALCSQLENMIIAGVTGDAKECKLTLAQLRLLDDIEEGIHYTRSYLERSKSGKRQIMAGHIGDFALQNGAYDPFCATIARVLINAQVQGGKKIQDVFQKLQEKYGIDKREQFQIGQILLDLGYPVRTLLDGEDMIDQFYA